MTTQPKLTDPIASVPLCRIAKVGPYGLYFAYRKGDRRPAPGTSYLYAWHNWCRRFLK